MQLEGKSALVTGGGRGIGRAIALAYAREGADVAVVSRTSAEVEEVSAEIRALGRRGLALTADLIQAEGASHAAAAAIKEMGKVDILVNNVGGYRMHTDNQEHRISVVDMSEAEWRRVLDSNLTTVFMTSKAVLPHMVDRGSGVIISLGSQGVAALGLAGQASYCASKAASQRLNEALADEVKEFGIAVNTLDPGRVLTRVNEDYDIEVHKLMRLPEDIADVEVHHVGGVRLERQLGATAVEDVPQQRGLFVDVGRVVLHRPRGRERGDAEPAVEVSRDLVERDPELFALDDLGCVAARAGPAVETQ